VSLSSARVVVVGAGKIGAAVAEALADDGAHVTVSDRGPAPASGATGAAMGHVVLMVESDAQLALTAYAQRLWSQRAATLPAAAERVECGTLWIAADDGEMGAVRRKHARYARHGIASTALDERQLREAEPNLRTGLAGGLLVPGDSVVSPPPIAAAMLDRVRALGGEVRFGHGVAAMSGAAVHLDDGSALECDFAVNATGAAAATLSAGCQVRPRKGHLVLTQPRDGFVRRQLVELGYVRSAHAGDDARSVAFNVQPRPNGQVIIGSSRQFDDESSAVDHEMLSRMLNRAIEYMPAIATLGTVRAWTGFRAATPDHLPLIGPHPDDARLVLATGHEGLGITTSLATGRLLADRIAGRTPAIPIEPYLPDRFAPARRRAAAVDVATFPLRNSQTA
jgi:glycine/D-amino acid oxidase-like deaminating enzyme